MLITLYDQTKTLGKKSVGWYDTVLDKVFIEGNDRMTLTEAKSKVRKVAVALYAQRGVALADRTTIESNFFHVFPLRDLING